MNQILNRILFILFILIILIILFHVFIISKENMTNNYNQYLNDETSIMVKNNVFGKDEPIEITSLPKCNKNIMVDYDLNINTLNNNGVTINQIINDPLINTIEVDNENYNLVQIEWRKTNFTFNGNPIGLTLHLIHSNYKSIEKLTIIIPLNLTDENENIETFKNVLYKKMNNFFKERIPKPIKFEKKNITNLNNLFSDLGNITENKIDFQGKFNLPIEYNKKFDIENININKLLNDQEKIPIYYCCKNTIGQVIRMDLCLLKVIIESNDTFYIIKEENGNINLISDFNIFNENNGLLIRSYIEKDDNLIYLKP